MDRFSVGYASLDITPTDLRIASVAAVGAVYQTTNPPFHGPHAYMHQPHVRPRKCHHKARETLGLIKAAAVQAEPSVFEIAKKLLDPHPAAVGAQRQVVGFGLVGADKPRIVLPLRVADRYTDRAVRVLFGHVDSVEIAVFAPLFRGEIADLCPLPVRELDVGIAVQSESVGPRGNSSDR